MLSHLDAEGNPSMVDVGSKAITHRVAEAAAKVLFPEAIFRELSAGGFQSGKGPIIATAIIAGTMAAKKTHELIPFCHPLSLNSCKIRINPLPEDFALEIRCAVGVEARTGVEMEALTAVSAAALCVYDMCKSLSHELIISDVCLLKKTGGKSSFQKHEG